MVSTWRKLLFFITTNTHDLSASPFPLWRESPWKIVAKVRFLRIHVYGLLAMHSEPHIVGFVIRILSEKSHDTSCGGGNEA